MGAGGLKSRRNRTGKVCMTLCTNEGQGRGRTAYFSAVTGTLPQLPPRQRFFASELHFCHKVSFEEQSVRPILNCLSTTKKIFWQFWLMELNPRTRQDSRKR